MFFSGSKILENYRKTRYLLQLPLTVNDNYIVLCHTQQQLLY